MNKEEKECFVELHIQSTNEIAEVLQMISDSTSNLLELVNLLKINHEILGMIEFAYYNNVVKGRIHYYKASLAREWYYKEFPSREYNIDKFEVTTYSYESLFYSVLSGNREWAVRMANLFGSYKELETDEFLANELLGYGLKYVILDDKEHAEEYIQKLEDNKDKRGMKQYAKGYARAYRGIIERDTEEFNQGLLFMLKNHASRMVKNGKNMMKYFAYDSVALAMIARERGIEITVEHELLPKNYLEETDIDYSKLKLFEE